MHFCEGLGLEVAQGIHCDVQGPEHYGFLHLGGGAAVEAYVIADAKAYPYIDVRLADRIVGFIVV